MKTSKIFAASMGLLTALAIVAPGVQAHNPAKYTNIPFMYATSCSTSDFSTENFVNSSSGVALQVNLQANVDAGAPIRIMCTSPGIGQPSSGFLNLAGTFALGSTPGTLTFNLTGSTANISSISAYASGVTPDGGPPSWGIVGTPITVPSGNGGVVSVPFAQGHLIFGPYNGACQSMVVVIEGNGSASTLLISNPRLNNSPILFDTSFTGNVNNLTPEGESICDD